MAVYTNSEGALQLRATEFAMPTDNVEVARHGIIGTASGRIFLACRNGTLSELMYVPG